MPYFRIDPTKDIGHPPEYFLDRDCQIDGRGEIHISPLSHWGVGVVVITASHDPNEFGRIVCRMVTVEDYAWIASGVLLFNCHIGEGAIVAAGTVVRSRDVPAYTMVEGNPARIIATREHGNKWQYYEEPAEIPIKR